MTVGLSVAIAAVEVNMTIILKAATLLLVGTLLLGRSVRREVSCFSGREDVIVAKGAYEIWEE